MVSWRRSAHMAHTPLSELSLGRIRTDDGGFDLATSELVERPVASAEALHAPAEGTRAVASRSDSCMAYIASLTRQFRGA